MMTPIISFNHKVFSKDSCFYSRKANSTRNIVYGLVFVLLILVNINAFAALSGAPGATVSQTNPVRGDCTHFNFY
jgi:hypothetical protein